MEDKQRPLILITNDDGVSAQGIRELTELMRALGDVVVVAPDSARSGAACSITPATPVGLKRLHEEPGLLICSCTGTPVDCVKMATEHATPRQPDLLVSGVNHGDNASVSLHYSGTIGAVIEGCMKGIPSIGYSIRTRKQQLDFAPYRQAISTIAQRILRTGLPQDICLNVNFPEVEHLQGIRVCRTSRGQWSGEWVTAHHPGGAPYYWLGGHFTNLESNTPDTDYGALDEGFASITPLQLDMTAHRYLAALKDLEQ